MQRGWELEESRPARRDLAEFWSPPVLTAVGGLTVRTWDEQVTGMHTGSSVVNHHGVGCDVRGVMSCE